MSIMHTVRNWSAYMCNCDGPVPTRYSDLKPLRLNDSQAVQLVKEWALLEYNPAKQHELNTALIECNVWSVLKNATIFGHPVVRI